MYAPRHVNDVALSFEISVINGSRRKRGVELPARACERYDL